MSADIGKKAVEEIMAIAKHRDPHQKEFLQALEEVAESLQGYFSLHPETIPIFKRMMEPERAIIFRIPWVNDAGVLEVNRGFRVQYNSALGPYKGGLRFHPTVNLGIIKFLGFEQVLKNSLTTLPMGGGKGGSDFDPKGKSEGEVMRFCQSLMTELYRHIGPDTDVPAGDIGVGGREVGYLYGQYKRITKTNVGVLTGKGATWGGSLIRPEATGYGTVYFCKYAIKDLNNEEIAGQTFTISGSGNVAQFAAERVLSYGGKVLTFSDSNGYIHEPEGFTTEQIAVLMELKNVRRERVSKYTEFSKTAIYVADKRPWEVPCNYALPCATQNEIEKADAEALAKNGCKGVFEGANMPSDSEAIEVYFKHDMIYGPGKAANAGGVAVSGLEMSQNSMRLRWTREEVDKKLQDIMKAIYDTCKESAVEMGQPRNLQLGANVGGFKKVAIAMAEQGCV